MDIGYILIILACVTVAADLLFLLSLLKTSRDGTNRIFHIPFYLTIALLICAYIRISIAFLTDDFTYVEVFRYSSTGLPLIFKFADMWISERGSLLFLCLSFAIAYLILRVHSSHCSSHCSFQSAVGGDGAKTEREKRILQKESCVMFVVADVFLIFLIILMLVENPFERFDFSPVEGWGLNPLLQNVWVLIHPPVLFIGYALTLLAFSIALAKMVVNAFGLESSEKSGVTSEVSGASREVSERGMSEGVSDDCSGGGCSADGANELHSEECEGGGGCSERSTLTVLFAWLFLSLGISLGGWWSYEVLGWGGYWAWDPVETASLLPWLALTAYFHLKPRREDLAREFSLFIAFFMVLFAFALTRGGLLESKHAFAASPLGYTALIFGALMGVIFLILRLKLMKPIYAFDVDVRSLHSLSLFIAFWSLLLALVACVVGEVMPIFGNALTGIEMSTEPEFFTKWCYPPTIAFVTALAGCNLAECSNMSVKRFSILTWFVAYSGAFLAYINFPLPNVLANFGIPFLIFAALAVIPNLVRTVAKSQVSAFGRALIHLAVIVILIGVFVSSSAEVEKSVVVALGDEVNVFGTKMHIDNECRFYVSKGTVYKAHILPEYTALGIDLTVRTPLNTYKDELCMRYYPNYELLTRPLIISEPLGDIYISMKYTDSLYNALRNAMIFGETSAPSDFVIDVKYVPLVSLIWVGIIMMCAGMLIVISCNLKKEW